MSETYPEPYDPKAHDSFYAGYGFMPPGNHRRKRRAPKVYWTILAVVTAGLAVAAVKMFATADPEPQEPVAQAPVVAEAPNIGDAALANLAMTLDADGVAYPTKDAVLVYAQQVCTDWDRQAGFDYVLLGQLVNFDFDPTSAESFIRSSTPTYCPEHLSELPKEK